MSYCPHCGIEIRTEDNRFCPACGRPLDPANKLIHTNRRSLMSHLSYAISLVSKNPILLVPELIAVLITYLFGQALGSSFNYLNLNEWFSEWLGMNESTLVNITDYTDIPSAFWLLPIAIIFWLIVTAGVSGLFSFQTLYMASKAISDEKVNLMDSSNYLRPHLRKFFLASIIANLFALTIIMLPAALFMYSVMVVESVGIREGLSKGFRVQLDRVMTSIGLIILFYVSIFGIGLLPTLGPFLRFIPSAVIEITSLDIYMNHKYQRARR
jgi:hypothetical protein